MTHFQFGYFILILVLMDLIILRTLRKLLRDFLRSKKNKWEMYQLYASQSFKSRLLLDYISLTSSSVLKELQIKRSSFCILFI